MCVALMSACSSSKDATDSPIDASDTFGRPYGIDAAKTATENVFKGTQTHVDATSRAAVPGKHIAVISPGQSVLSYQIPSEAAVEAAKAIGWKADLLDAKLNPAGFGDMIRQAVSMNVDGILLISIDCSYAAQPLREAKDKNIAVVSSGGYDCDDPSVNAGPALFSGSVNYDNLAANQIGTFASSIGRDDANYIITQSNNSAHVLNIVDTTTLVLKYISAGFTDQIAHSGGTMKVTDLNIQSADLGPKVVQQIQAELLKHPDITWIRSPFSFATLAGVLPAIADQPGKYKVLGGEGLPPEIDAVRSGAVTAAMYIPSDWVAWACVDALNSVFRKEPTRPSGVGWQLVDTTHNMPATGGVVSPIDFKSEFKKAWGVSS